MASKHPRAVEGEVAHLTAPLAAIGERWVGLMEARGGGGKLKLAITLPGGYNSNVRAAMRAQVTGLYRQMFQEWPTYTNAQATRQHDKIFDPTVTEAEVDGTTT